MNELGDTGVALVAEALGEVRGLEELNLGGNAIGVAGAAALAAALQNNPDLQTLELGYNALGKEGAKEVAAAVKFHPSLRTLRLGWCQIGEEGAAEFAEALRFNEHLTCLDLRGNGLGDKGVGAFASIIQAVGFEKLEELDLGYNEIRDRGAFTMANAMKANPKELSLERMCLGNNYLTEFGKAAIDEAASLVGEFNPKGGLEIPY
jgi:Ran GTPase-activating protein (RanGAP) involved in mRNA processing and transport